MISRASILIAGANGKRVAPRKVKKIEDAHCEADGLTAFAIRLYPESLGQKALQLHGLPRPA
jgi:sulfur relay (sulfurtransferase) DsrC/TusE family protein